MSNSITYDELNENIIIIKINHSYKKGMPELELYEATRGIWRRNIESVKDAEYCLTVAFGDVVEVYKIIAWHPAGTIPMKTRVIDRKRCKGRVEFEGCIAEDEIRNKYIGRSVKDLYVNGESNPVKTFFRKKDIDFGINDAKEPIAIINDEDKRLVVCPRCTYKFIEAKRCPECGQLVDFKVRKKPKLKDIDEWANTAYIYDVSPSAVIEVIDEILENENISFHLGTSDLCLDYSSGKNNRLFLIMLFGTGGCAIQPYVYYKYFEKNKLNMNVLEVFLENIKILLSDDNKYSAYENIRGYYYIDYKMIVKRKNYVVKLFTDFCKEIDREIKS